MVCCTPESYGPVLSEMCLAEFTDVSSCKGETDKEAHVACCRYVDVDDEVLPVSYPDSIALPV